MKRKPIPSPLVFRDGQPEIDPDAHARYLIAKAERNPDDARRLIKRIVSNRKIGREESPLLEAWLFDRLARLEQEKDAIRALCLSRKRGDHSLSKKEIFRRLCAIVERMARFGETQSEAATKCAEAEPRDRTTWSRLPAEHPDIWIDAVTHWNVNKAGHFEAIFEGEAAKWLQGREVDDATFERVKQLVADAMKAGAERKRIERQAEN